jgi:uncharacterized protein (DUF3084 family)
MDISSLTFVVIFAIMGGLVAFIGDVLGRRLGKKRLRIGKLRPHHTATTVTVIVGSLIPILTTYGIATISKETRRWLAEGTRLVAEVQRLDNTVKQLSQDVQEREKRREQLRQENERLNQDTIILAQQVHQSLKRAEEARRQLSRTQGLLQNLQARVRDLQIKRQQAEEQATLAQKHLQEMRHTLQQAEKKLQEAEHRIALLQTEEASLQERLQTAQKAEAEARESARLAEAELDRTRQNLLQLRETETALRRTIGSLIQGVQAVRTSRLIYHRGEELARTTLTGGVPPEVARQKLEELLHQANVSARERGVMPDASGRAATLQDRLRPMPDGSFVRISVEDQIKGLISAITATPRDLVMIATSYYNYFEQDKDAVPLEVNVYFNRTVYRKGQTIASTIIDGSRSEEEILDAVVQFLTEQVRTNAQQAGMIPVHGKQESLGQIGFTEINQLIKTIRQKAKPVVVDAVAARDTKSAEPLELTFRIKDTPTTETSKG